MKKVCLFLVLVLGVMVGVVAAADVEVKLDSDDGTSAFILEDSSETKVATMDSNGNLYVSGKVGIGTKSPAGALDIVGDMNITGTVGSSTQVIAPQFLKGGSAAGMKLGQENQAGSCQLIAVDGVEKLHIHGTSGYVGIGT
ncbi:MAG: hypothetical protein ABIA67_02525, partial [Candidatus Margulisiibacteriota bacterium]